MLCPSCHKENRENAKFCKFCGYSFVAANSAANTAHTATNAPVDVTNTATGGVANTTSPANVVTAADPTNTAAPPQGQDTMQSASANGGQAPQVGQQGQQAVDNQVVEVVVPADATPQQQDPTNTTNPTDTAHTNTDTDATQILSHEEMLALQAKRQRQLAGEGQGDQPVATGATGAIENSSGVPETPVPPSLNQTPEGDVVAGEPPQDIAPQTSTSGTPIPPPPPAEDAEQGGQDGQNMLTDLNDGDMQVETPQSPASQQSEGNQNAANEVQQAPVEEGGVQPSSTDASALQVGAVVGGRYEVTDVLDADEQDAGVQPVGRIYHVIDHQGYQRCWNCGSEQNAEGDEFCIDCGAELLNAPYVMHEYPNGSGDAASNQTGEAHVLQGNIVNTFVENGRTYVIEQPQEAEIAFPNGVHMLVAGDSDAGNVRRSEPNEDSILVMQLQRVHESHASPSGVFIIADGMGGHANGQGASRMIINGIAQRMMNSLFLPPLNSEDAGQEVKPVEDTDLIAMLKDAVQESNNELVQANQRNKSDAGSTLTGFMIVNDHAYIINVGDSRTYLLREGTLYQLTTDHSLVAQLVAGGLIEPDDVYTHPQRSQIFRSLGDKTNVQIDDFKQQLLPGDILLSCSDGLWEMVRNPQIADILNNAHDPQMACTQLIEAANTNGGEDNVSAIVVLVR